MKEDKIKYISLHEATKFCNYSQKYLNLRINQGKLRAIKIGRNWVTTKEWIKDYIKNNNNHHNSHNNSHNNKHNSRKNTVNYKKFVVPPENLPIEPVSEVSSRRTKEPSLILATSAIFILLTCSVFINRVGIGQTIKDGFNCFDRVANISDQIFDENIKSISESYNNIFRTAKIIGEGGNIFVQDIAQGINQIFSDMKYFSIRAHKIISENISVKIDKTSFSIIGSQKNQTSENSFKNTLNIFNDYKNWMSENIYRLSVKIHDEFLTASLSVGEKTGSLNIQRLIYQFKQKFLAINDLMENKINKGVLMISQIFIESKENITEKKLTPTTKEGLVVIPSTEKNEEIKQKIQESFSDEVKVEIKDESSGIITPVFKEREGEEYLYILVPINN